MIEVVRSDVGQPWHVRIAAGNAEPLSVSEQLTGRDGALINLIAQAKAFGFDDPHVEMLDEQHGLLRAGPTLAGFELPADLVIAAVRIVDERDQPS